MMLQWQTTVSGKTWQDINDAAEEEIYRFFENGDLRASVFAVMQLDIRPGEIVSIRDAAGRIVDERIDSYQATVTVEL